uniref:Lysozyme n=1 Tax=Acrobeloides nanus TaxID=290746 RepID=A0A914CVB6_9BILA
MIKYIPLIFPFLLIIPDVVNFVASGFVIRTSSPAISKDQWDCWTKQGLTDALIRVYHPKGYVDAAGVANLVAWQELDEISGNQVGYSPCLANCQNNLTMVPDQINALVDELKKNGIDFDVLQILIEIDPSQPWSENKTANQQILLSAINTIANMDWNYDYQVNIISSNTSWSKIFGASFTKPSTLYSGMVNLYWIYWNGKPGLEEWTSFGGWTIPAVHEYAGNINNSPCTDAIYAIGKL